jgi:NADH dehydrogenase
MDGLATLSDEATAIVDSPPPERKRVVIVGGGFAGLAAAHALRYADAEVLLIDRRNHHIFQPLLYQVATAVLSPADIAAPIRQLEVKQRNLSVALAEVTGVNVASHTIEVASPSAGVRKIAFDYLVVRRCSLAVPRACARMIVPRPVGSFRFQRNDFVASLHQRP